MIELIHTSDWHLGNPFSAFGQAQQKRLAEARFEGVARLFAYAREHEVRLMLCAGDQIDNGELRSTSILLRLFGIVSSYPEIQVVMIAGNHDPFTPSSVYARVDAASYPKNLLFVDRPRAVDLPEHGVRILAAPLAERFGRTNPIEELCREEAAGSTPAATVVVGLAHGSAAVSETVGGESDAFPIPPELAKAAGLDYLALGDWHSHLARGDRTCYPGTHEPLAFGDDAGSLHVTLAERGARPKVERIAGGVCRWIDVERTLGDESLEGFLAELDSGRSPVGPGSGGVGAAGGDALVRFRLGGFVSFDRFKRLEEGLAIARERYLACFIERMPEVRPSDAELREIASEGYMKRVVERLIERAADGGEEAAAAESALLRVYSFFHPAGGRS